MVTGSGVDVQALKARIDLLDLAGRDTRLKKTASTRGGEFAGPCPFCGGRDRFHVQPQSGLWYCRQCSPAGRWRDAIAYVQQRDGLGFREACEVLGASASELGERPNRNIAKRPQQLEVHLADDIEPPDSWRDRALAFVEAAAAALWTDAGARARAYLEGRGFREETLRVWRVGFQEADAFEPATRWGLPPLGDDGRPARVWLARGIVLPWLRGDTVDQVKIRRAVVAGDGDKYASIRGGHPLLFGADTLVPGAPAVMTEGEFDALLLWQAASDRTAVVSLGSATRLPTRRAALLLAQAQPLFLAYDVDGEGEKGAARIQQLAPRARRIKPPTGKDVGEFVEGGGRARAWVAYELARVEVRR